MPNQDERRSRRIELSILLKAAEKSRSETSDYLMTHSLADTIMNGDKSIFSRMMNYRIVTQTNKLSVSRIINQSIAVQ